MFRQVIEQGWSTTYSAPRDPGRVHARQGKRSRISPPRCLLPSPDLERRSLMDLYLFDFWHSRSRPAVARVEQALLIISGRLRGTSLLDLHRGRQVPLGRSESRSSSILDEHWNACAFLDLVTGEISDRETGILCLAYGIGRLLMSQTVIENPVIMPFTEPCRHFLVYGRRYSDEIIGAASQQDFYFHFIARPQKKGKQLASQIYWTRRSIEENRFVDRVS